MSVFDWLYRLLRWGLGLVFIYAGSTKLLEPSVFAVLIDAFGLIPENLVLFLAIALPALEVIAGMGLLFDIRGSLSMITGLLVLFLAVLGYGLWMGLDVDCGCFGPEDPESKAFHSLRLSLYRDMIMLAGTAYLFGWRRYRTIKPVSLKRVINKIVRRRTEDVYV